VPACRAQVPVDKNSIAYNRTPAQVLFVPVIASRSGFATLSGPCQLILQTLLHPTGVSLPKLPQDALAGFPMQSRQKPLPILLFDLIRRSDPS